MADITITNLSWPENEWTANEDIIYNTSYAFNDTRGFYGVSEITFKTINLLTYAAKNGLRYGTVGVLTQLSSNGNPVQTLTQILKEDKTIKTQITSNGAEACKAQHAITYGVNNIDIGVQKMTLILNMQMNYARCYQVVREVNIRSEASMSSSLLHTAPVGTYIYTDETSLISESGSSNRWVKFTYSGGNAYVCYDSNANTYLQEVQNFPTHNFVSILVESLLFNPNVIGQIEKVNCTCSTTDNETTSQITSEDRRYLLKSKENLTIQAYVATVSGTSSCLYQCMNNGYSLEKQQWLYSACRCVGDRYNLSTKTIDENVALPMQIAYDFTINTAIPATYRESKKFYDFNYPYLFTFQQSGEIINLEDRIPADERDNTYSFVATATDANKNSLMLNVHTPGSALKSNDWQSYSWTYTPVEPAHNLSAIARELSFDNDFKLIYCLSTDDIIITFNVLHQQASLIQNTKITLSEVNSTNQTSTIIRSQDLGSGDQNNQTLAFNNVTRSSSNIDKLRVDLLVSILNAERGTTTYTYSQTFTITSLGIMKSYMNNNWGDANVYYMTCDPQSQIVEKHLVTDVSVYKDGDWHHSQKN